MDWAAGLCSQEVEGDTSFGSDENLGAAAELEIKLIAPVGGKRSSKLGLERFSFQKRTGHVKACPEGHKPEGRWRTKKGRFLARFPLKHCESCRLRVRYPVQLGKAGAHLRYSAKGVRLAKRRA